MSNQHATQVDSIIRRVWLGQLLFSAGHSLTTGGFLSYFSNPYFRGYTFAFAAFQITPEAAESLSFISRFLVRFTGNPKRVWWSALILARIVALGIPLIALYGSVPGHTFVMLSMIASLAAWYLLLGVSHISYLSWLSDQVPEVNWGRLLASRSIAVSLITIITTWTASRIVDWAIQETAWSRERVYLSLFLLGGGLCASSILPLISVSSRWNFVDDVTTSTPGTDLRTIRVLIHDCWQNLELRRFLIGSWQLAFFQGLTQTAQFQLSKDILHVSLSTYYSMVSLMLLLQIPLAALSGKWVDLGRERGIMFSGLLVLSLSMGCWILACWYGPVWLWISYGIWGVFGLVNVAQPGMALKLSPRGDNTFQLSLVRPVGGLLAALAGLIGGSILGHFSTGKLLAPPMVFVGLFAISGLGRAAAAWWFKSPQLSIRRNS